MSVNTVISSILILSVAASKVHGSCISYPVALDSLGPRPCPLPPVGTIQSTPVIEKPIIRLPAIVPCPRTISNKCRCMKTIVKPQVYHQLINVPTIQRYIEIRHRPVVEKIHYNAHPINVGCRDVCGNAAYYDDGEYADCSRCCCRRSDVCTVPVAAAMPVTASVPVAYPVRTAVPVAAAMPVRRAYPIATRCYEPCIC